jgi:hypothetical protein
MLRYAVLLILGCTTRVETMSQPTTLRLRFAERCEGAVLEHAGRGVAIHGETADVNVAAMRGGYSESAGRVSNVHDPHDYRVVTMRKDARVLVELSITDIRALPKDPEGRAIVRAPCGA